MSRRSFFEVLVLVCVALAAGCGSSSNEATVGRLADGGRGGSSVGGASDSSAGGAGGVTFDTDGSGRGALGVEIQRDHVAIEFVTLSCAGECADVQAVAHGGYDPYSYRWEDGSTDPVRHLCPNGTTSYTVTVTDNGIAAGEFPRAPITSDPATVTAQVLTCGDAGGPVVDAGGTVGTTVYWANWNTVSPGTPGAAEGTISPPEGDIRVTYAGELGAESQPAGGATNDFLPETTYKSATVANGPPNGGRLSVSGNANLTQTIQFSRPVRNPLVAVWSMGFGLLGIPSTWQFGETPEVLSSGISTAWPLGSTLTASGQDVTGNEGNGVIQLDGTFSQISFTVPTPEPAPGYGTLTVGVRGGP